MTRVMEKNNVPYNKEFIVIAMSQGQYVCLFCLCCLVFHVSVCSVYVFISISPSFTSSFSFHYHFRTNVKAFIQSSHLCTIFTLFHYSAHFHYKSKRYKTCLYVFYYNLVAPVLLFQVNIVLYSFMFIYIIVIFIVLIYVVSYI